MAQKIKLSTLRQRRAELCFNDFEFKVLTDKTRLGGSVAESMYRMYIAAEKLNPNKCVNDEMLAEWLQVPVEKIVTEYKTSKFILSKMKGLVLHREFGVGYRIATEKEAVDERAKTVSRMIALSRNMEKIWDAVEELKVYDWAELKNEPDYLEFKAMLFVGAEQLQSACRTQTKLVEKFKTVKYLAEKAREATQRPLFEK